MPPECLRADRASLSQSPRFHPKFQCLAYFGCRRCLRENADLERIKPCFVGRLRGRNIGDVFKDRPNGAGVPVARLPAFRVNVLHRYVTHALLLTATFGFAAPLMFATGVAVAGSAAKASACVTVDVQSEVSAAADVPQIRAVSPSSFAEIAPTVAAATPPKNANQYRPGVRTCEMEMVCSPAAARETVPASSRRFRGNGLSRPPERKIPSLAVDAATPTVHETPMRSSVMATGAINGVKKITSTVTTTMPVFARLFQPLRYQRAVGIDVFMPLYASCPSSEFPAGSSVYVVSRAVFTVGAAVVSAASATLSVAVVAVLLAMANARRCADPPAMVR